MIKSLRGTNGYFARIGNPQVQPVTDDDQNDFAQMSSVATGEALPVSQVKLASKAHVVDTSGMHALSDTSVDGLANAVISESAVIPRMPAKIAAVTPGYPSSGKYTKVESPSFITADVKKFEPYEQLSAVSSERPEIVMVMDYRPLFENDIGKRSNLTPIGQLVDTNIQIRSLASDNTRHLVKSLSDRYIDMNDSFKTRRTSFKQSVEALRTSSMFLVNLIRKAEKLKQQLDLRDELHIVPAHDLAQQYVASTLQSMTSVTSQRVIDQVRRLLPNTYDITDTFIRLGYTKNNIGSYASTKLWLQLLAELKNILRAHSLEFLDIDPTAQRNDKSPLVLTQDNQKRFVLPTLETTFLPSWDSLRAIQPSLITDYVNAVSKAYSRLYEPVHFKSETARIAALVHVVSKEIRLSRAFGDEETQRILQQNYGYNQSVNAGNAAIFDTVIGRFGTNVTAIPQLFLSNVASLAYEQPGENLAVMTFESRYIESTNGTLSAGGAYYVDSSLQPAAGEFDTTRLDALSARISTQVRALNNVSKGLRWIIPVDRDTDDEKSTSVTDPIYHAEKLLYTFVDKTTGTVLPIVRDDRLSALYSLANDDVTLKSLLFAYTVCRSTRTYYANDLTISAGPDNTASTEHLIVRIAERLRTITMTSRSTVQQVSNRQNPLISDVLTHDSIVAALKTGTPLSTEVENLFGWVVRGVNNTIPNQSQNTRSLVGSLTRFSGTVDSMVALAAFDSIVSLLARISNQKIVGQQGGRTLSQVGVTTYVVQKTTNNHLETIRDVIGRLEKEIALTQQLMYCVIHTLTQLMNSIQSFSNYLKADGTRTTLREIMKVVNDASVMKLLMTEQQALLLASTVDDLYQRATATGVISTNGDVNTDGTFDQNDANQILDENVITPKLRDVLYATFGSSEFSQRKDANKKIIAVGIPQGFAAKIKQRVNAKNVKRTTFNDRQSDIIKVAVYRVDMRHADIVYKPQKFIFELSRFAVRNDQKFLDMREDATMTDVIASVPTRDMMTSSDNEISYYSPEGGLRLAQVKPSLSEPSYEFLSESEKAQLIKNHVLSYMVEVYVHLLTGISVAEHHFDMMPSIKTVEETFAQSLVKGITHSLSDAATNSFKSKSGVLFASTGVRKIGSVGDVTSMTVRDKAVRLASASNVSMKNMNNKTVASSVHNMRVVASLTNSVTPLSEPLRIAKKLLTPKKFDRVFNIIIDPDDFEIDYAKTVRTKHGQKSLERLITSGDVVTLTGDAVRLTKNILGGNHIGSRPGLIQGRSMSDTIFKFRDRDKTTGDLSFDKYFVAIETMDEDEE